MRTWYIEDAGGGCRAFSEVLVLVSENPREIHTVKLPLTWNENIGLEEMACRLVIDMLEKAGVSKDDRLLVCSGNIFHTLHQWLSSEGYNWNTAKMDGLAHDAAEEAFYRQLVEAGVPKEYKLNERDYRSFYRLVEDWVKQQPDPSKYWKNRSVRRKPAEARYKLKSTFARPRRCRKCRQTIKPFSPLVEHTVRSGGKKHRIYYHPECSPVTPLKGKLNYAAAKLNGSEINGLILPNKNEVPCPICGQPIAPGEPTFYGYCGERLIFGHQKCLVK